MDERFGIGDLELLHPDDVDKWVDEMVDSHEWWVFVGATRLLTVLEETYYFGPFAGDFKLIMGPMPTRFREELSKVGLEPNRMTVMSFAKKSRCSPKMLANLIKEQGGPAVTKEQLSTQDILWLFDEA